MKKLSILALSATVAITPAFAETDVNYNTPSTELTPVTELSTQQADLSFAFDDAENLQATDMTLAEMQETQGAVAPYVGRIGLGFAGGFGGSAIGQYHNSGKVDWGLATKHGLYGAGLGGASRWLANRGWY